MPREEKPRAITKDPCPRVYQALLAALGKQVPTDTPSISYAALGNVLRKAEMPYVEKVTYIPLPYKKVNPRSQSSREDSQSSVA